LQLKFYILLFYTLQSIQKKNTQRVRVQNMTKEARISRRVWEENLKMILEKECVRKWIRLYGLGQGQVVCCIKIFDKNFGFYKFQGYLELLLC